MQSLKHSQVAALGGAQTLAWASSVYLPALLARPMASALGVGEPVVFAAFTAALGVSAALGPWAGRHIDRAGGRRLLMASNALFTAGLVLLALAPGGLSMALAWLVLGVAMGCGLYDTAFASLVRWEGAAARRSITAVTLMAGFASTVGWPLSAWMEAHWGWRGACVGWAALHLVIGLPLNAMLPRTLPAVAVAPAETASAAPGAVRRPAWVLAGVFMLSTAITSAMASHLPRLLEAAGSSWVQAVALAALVGPAQVLARVLEFGWLRRWHPLHAARGAAVLHPLGAGLLLGWGPVAAPLFAVLHGAGNGLLTISKGTLPLALFGAAGYGQRQALIMLPGRVAGALAPWAFAFALGQWGAASLWIGLGFGAVATLGLWTLRVPRSQ